MEYTKKELEEYSPLAELLQNQVRGVKDVTGLVEVTKNLIVQIETLYAEKELLFEKTNTKSIEEVIFLIQGMEEQLNSLYSEPET
ncbi:hypothetical protein LEP1GSC195_0815 [Leptospira wolbachii serovar Codice str. CDC]|uniref:Uncharacterized protein n=1 Tax=Leptospira wolbachii serovar Codice str. CDC TaxID=1218599 RepID=R8ZZ55_9LEPT|nr:hypothetical protein [Leptospira wolbachii]EOQ95049.1 hypothetical protein LEP1GSC195_0815 [Leptospira wolbachii serovar Codice str. CDC]